MFNIRTKLIATLLLVALVPVLPSYYLAKALVSGFVAISSNQALGDAVARRYNNSYMARRCRARPSLSQPSQPSRSPRHAPGTCPHSATG